MQHIRRFKLPHGVHVKFSYPVPHGVMHVEWDPAMPEFTSNRAARRFEEAYRAARDTFMQDIAQLIGGKVLVLDLTEDWRDVERATTLEPQPIQ